MKVLLIGPTALDNKGKPITQSRLYLPGLTLPMLAAVTPEEVELKLVFETVDRIPFDEHWDLVGLTGMGSGLYRAWEIADQFRERNIPVILGGIAASLINPAESLQHVDSVIIGEAENTWPTVLEDLQNGGLQEEYRVNQAPDINNLPVPRLDLLEKNKMGLWRPVQTARGCPFPCNFCSVTTYFKQTYRKQPIKNVIRDVRAAKATGSKFIAFIDDNIGVDMDHARQLFEALIPEKIIWISQSSLHIADNPEILQLAYESGCRLLSFGIETTNSDSLSSIDKEFNKPNNYRALVKRIKSHGIDVSTEMMVGLEEDDESVFQKTYDFIMGNRISTPRIHIFTPIPGTPIFEELEKEGRITSRDYNLYSGGNVMYLPKSLDPEMLQKNYWKLYEALFTWPAIWKRLSRNEAGLGPIMRAFVVGVNLHYKNHIRKRICPGIV